MTGVRPGGDPVTPHAWKGQSVRTRLKLIVFSLLPLALLLGSAELLASRRIHREFHVTKDPATGAGRYTMSIGRWPWRHESVVPLNSLGFADDEFTGVLPKRGCAHVVFAGDSFVFGDGVDRDKSFFQLVKAQRAKAGGEPCVRFFNVGERATTIEQQAQRIRETLPLLEPDVVVLGQYENDLSDLTKHGFVAEAVPDERPDVRRPTDIRLPTFNTSLVRLGQYHLFAFLITQGIAYDALARWSVLEQPGNEATAERLKAIYRELYDALVAELRARGIAFGVIILPGKFNVMAHRLPEEGFFVSLAEAARAPCLRLLPVLDAQRSPYAYLMYDGHLNEHGNQVVGRAVFEWLFESEPAPFARLRGRISAGAAGP
jgi:hypothetical protein